MHKGSLKINEPLEHKNRFQINKKIKKLHSRVIQPSSQAWFCGFMVHHFGHH